MRRGLLAALLLAATLPAHAGNEVHSFTRGSMQRIADAYQGRAFVLALWSLSCTHCVDDLALFDKLARKHREFRLVLVSTDAPEQRAEIVRKLHEYHLDHAESWVFADSYTERLRFEVDGDWYGELPRTYFYDAQGRGVGVSGRLERAQVERWLRENARAGAGGRQSG